MNLHASPTPRRIWQHVAAGAVVFAIIFAAVSREFLRATDYHLGYALDDSYIHMSIARNLALHGSWGINPGTFASASSSPLWTALLGLIFRVAGVHDSVPLVLNLGAALLLLVLLGAVVEARAFSALESLATFASVVLFAPMVPMVWIGMEHSLNNVCVLLLGWWASSIVARGQLARPVDRLFPLLVIATVALRVEGVFVAAACVLLFLATRRLALAVASLVAAVAPVTVVGLWNQSHGWFFLPASVMMKQTVLPADDGTWLASLAQGYRTLEPPGAFIGMLVGALVLLAIEVRRARSFTQACLDHSMLAIVIASSVLHTALARFGFLYRYESYLMVLGVVAIALTVQRRSGDIASRLRLLDRKDVVAAIALVAVVLGASRTVQSASVLINTGGHIYRQHRQMARFVSQYYDTSAVAINDIGTVSYYSDARVFDLFGLASLESATAKRQGSFDATFINTWLDSGQVPIAIVYDAWFQGNRRFHDRWIKVARWVTDDQDRLDEGAVTFYARTPESATQLARQMSQFTSTLPARVIVERYQAEGSASGTATGVVTTAKNSSSVLQ